MCGIWGAITSNYELEDLLPHFYSIKHRGPDQSKWIELNNKKGYFMFHRLAINCLNNDGQQPMINNHVSVMCNGEIYNYKDLADEEIKGSDCKIIDYLYVNKNNSFEELVPKLDGYYAISLYDNKRNILYLARDPIGVRPLFFGLTNNRKEFFFASEAKALHNLCIEVHPFPPGCIGKWTPEKGLHFSNHFRLNKFINMDETKWITKEKAKQKLKDLFFKAISKRMMSDRPIGFLLSGGLDSSLVTSIGSKIIREKNPNAEIHTFSIGLNNSPDLKNAKIVADYLNTIHHEIKITDEDMIAVLPEVIRQNESYDITTTRASVPNYLLTKYISKETNIKVIFSGEGSDELFGGYLYFKNAPSRKEFHEETIKLMNDLYMFDVLRCDRTTSINGLEVRVPFLDIEFMSFVMSLPESYKYPIENNNIEKYILREVFEDYLPNEIVWRTKDAFSDAVGYSWVDKLDKISNEIITNNVEQYIKNYDHNPPITKEALWYRKIFDHYYPNRSSWISHYWLPNWTNNKIEPSARKVFMDKS